MLMSKDENTIFIWQNGKKKIFFDELSDIFAVRIIGEKYYRLLCHFWYGHTHYKVFSKEFLTMSVHLNRMDICNSQLL